MGHDTIGYVLNLGERVAYLRRSMWPDSKNHIYELLGERAMQHNARVSGDGGNEVFAVYEIRKALIAAKEQSIDQDIIKFLSDLQEGKDDYDDILIHFG